MEKTYEIVVSPFATRDFKIYEDGVCVLTYEASWEEIPTIRDLLTQFGYKATYEDWSDI